MSSCSKLEEQDGHCHGIKQGSVLKHAEGKATMHHVFLRYIFCLPFITHATSFNHPNRYQIETQSSSKQH